ncbi:MAG TPA: phosphatase PAP2 family protein [Gemmatimonadales bacterium]|nr:phosphatase PAP2 family protein [Gemmatimonadales bacterium]
MAVALRNSATTAATSLRAVDLLLLGYLGLVTVVAVIRASHQPGFRLLLLGHALFVVFLFLLTRPGHGRVGRTIREIYPLFLLPALYAELDILNTPLGPVYDHVVQHWEMLVFGSQISREWWQAAPSRFWSTTLHAAYLSYYFIVSVPGLYFAWRGNLDAVRRFVLVVMTTFIVCYIVFIFFPVAGPYYTFPPPSPWFTDNFAARLVYQALETGSSYGAAFPSSHVAAALAATISASRVSTRLGLVLLVPTLLLTVGVVYCQMHYGVDALAGVVLGGAMAWLFRGEIRKTAREEARHQK